MNPPIRYKLCPSCGTENSANSADCQKCGADILSERVETRVHPGSETKDEVSHSDREVEPLVRIESIAVPGLSFSIAEGQTVGRSDQADIVIEAIPDLDSISRIMARFMRNGPQWYVQHVGATNFIAVDGETYEEDDEVVIRDGTVLNLALCPFVVRISDSP